LKLVENLDESWIALQQAFKENFQQTQSGKSADGEDIDETLSDGPDDEDERAQDDDAKSSAEEADVKGDAPVLTTKTNTGRTLPAKKISTKAAKRNKLSSQDQRKSLILNSKLISTGILPR
jgi:hypothetical protein